MLLDTKAAGDIVLGFSTPILIRRWQGVEVLNQHLATAILAREAAEPEHRTGGQNRSNVGGWRSEPGTWSWPGREFDGLRDLISQGVGHMLRLSNGHQETRLKLDGNFTAWVNVNRSGSYNVPHSHPEASWSGVYYVDMGEPDADRPLNGAISFQDPRPGALTAPTPGFQFGFPHTVEPAPGTMLVFPNWLIHWVHPFFGKGARISVAFNLQVRKLEFLPP